MIEEKEIKRRLAQAIKDAPLSQVELCERLGVSEPTVSRWVNGTRTPNYKYLGGLCEILGVSPAWLLGLEERQQAKTIKYCPYCGERLERGSK